MTFIHTQTAPPFMQRSRAKLWVRSGLLAGRLSGICLRIHALKLVHGMVDA